MLVWLDTVWAFVYYGGIRTRIVRLERSKLTPDLAKLYGFKAIVMGLEPMAVQLGTYELSMLLTHRFQATRSKAGIWR